jgi:predicted HTH transcriptional regulator
LQHVAQLIASPEGKIVDDFKAGVSRIRNRVIVRVLRELGLVEEWGTGYSRIIQACEEGGHPLPAWRELGAALRVSFEPHPEAVEQAQEPADVPINVPINETVNERQRWFLTQVGEGQTPGASDLARQFRVSEKTARRDIADLKARGLVVFVGARKTGHYQLGGSQ